MSKLEVMFFTVGLVVTMFAGLGMMGIGDFRMYYGGDFSQSKMCSEAKK